MLRRKLYRNCTIGIPKNVLFVESWVIDFVLFEILIRRNWIYDDGKVRKADHHKETLHDQGGHMMGYMILSAAAGLVLARLLGWVWR